MQTRLCFIASALFAILLLLGASPHAFGGPAYGLNKLPTTRPISIGYLNALRGANGQDINYTPSQIITEIDGLNWSGFDAVVHAFAEPVDSNGTVGEGLGNFLAYQAALLSSAHARGKSVIMSIGGSYPDTIKEQFANIANDAGTPPMRDTFATNVAQYLEDHGYDGVDIDWEFPKLPGGSVDTAAGRQNMTNLMIAIYTKVKAKNPNYIVMFATGPAYYLGSYDFAQLKQYSDFFFYFGYDWKNPQNGPMTQVPPMLQSTTAGDHLSEQSVKGGIEYVLAKGFPAAKIICGLPFYGSFTDSWSSVRNTWAANPAAYFAAIDPNSMEVQINGEWFTSPDCMKKKMDALLKPSTSVLANHVVVRGVGCWEIGHEYRLQPDLSTAFAQWLAAYPPNSAVVLREAATGGGTQARVTFGTLPAGTYQVQAANSLTTPITWQSLGTASPNAQGQFQVIDPPPLPAKRFYRAVYP